MDKDREEFKRFQEWASANDFPSADYYSEVRFAFAAWQHKSKENKELKSMYENTTHYKIGYNDAHDECSEEITSLQQRVKSLEDTISSFLTKRRMLGDPAMDMEDLTKLEQALSNREEE